MMSVRVRLGMDANFFSWNKRKGKKSLILLLHPDLCLQHIAFRAPWLDK